MIPGHSDGSFGYASKRATVALGWKHDLGMHARQGLAVGDGTLFALTESLGESRMLYAPGEP
ncbi:hypothetical protein [Haladaptatus sp. NG-SE-30]